MTFEAIEKPLHILASFYAAALSLNAEVLLVFALGFAVILALLWALAQRRALCRQKRQLAQKAEDDKSWQGTVTLWQEKKRAAETELDAQNRKITALTEQASAAERQLAAAQRQIGLEQELSDGEFAGWLRALEAAQAEEAEGVITAKRNAQIFAQAAALEQRLSACNHQLNFAPPGADFLTLAQAAEREAQRQKEQLRLLRRARQEAEKLQAAAAAKAAALAAANQEHAALKAEAEQLAQTHFGADSALLWRNLDALEACARAEATAAKAAAALAQSRAAFERKAQSARAILTAAELSKNSEAAAESLTFENAERAIQTETELTKAEEQRLDEAHGQAIAERAKAETALRQIDGGEELPLLQQEQETVALELQAAAQDYIRLRCALKLAKAAMRRYRDAHRGGMIEATETAFAALTGGAYSKLQVRTEGSSESLIAIDKNGAAKQAGDMSKGTRFQLYMALRAAAYQQLIDKNINLPFFCDDIFETFDEERTAAACRLMQHIGQSGQAVYFTHHRHVAEIAKEICGDNVRLHTIN